jgi:hypothetical protein
MTDVQPASPEAPKPPRLTQGEIIRQLLDRGSGAGSSVVLSRNAKGETQIEVTVRTTDGGEVPSVTAAEALATEVYDRLRVKYPMSDGKVGA